MKVCDVCGSSLGFMKFRYEEGYLCKVCYEKASRHHVETIRHKTLDEILVICHNPDEILSLNEPFEVNRRVANYILFDDKHKKICVPNNRRVVNAYQQPEIYAYQDILGVTLETEPKMTLEDLLKLSTSKEKQIIHFLRIKITLKSKKQPCIVHVVTTPTRSTSYAFKQSFTFAQRIAVAVEKLMCAPPK